MLALQSGQLGDGFGFTPRVEQMIHHRQHGSLVERIECEPAPRQLQCPIGATATERTLLEHDEDRPLMIAQILAEAVEPLAAEAG